jgi:thiamine-monophosphate kinase
VSDGLPGDLGHVLKASGCGATIDTSQAIHLMDLMAARTQPQDPGSLVSRAQRLAYVLAGGDDYELLFTAPPAARAAVQSAAQASATPVTRIGRIEANPGLRLIDAAGQPVSGHFASFDHFA